MTKIRILTTEGDTVDVYVDKPFGEITRADAYRALDGLIELDEMCVKSWCPAVDKNPTLAAFIRNQIHELESMAEFSVATDSVRAWIDVWESETLFPTDKKESSSLFDDLEDSEPEQKKYLIVEDDCAPDAKHYFEEEMNEKYGLYIEDFIINGKKIEFGYEYGGYLLEKFPDDPYWHLSRK